MAHPDRDDERWFWKHHRRSDECAWYWSLRMRYREPRSCDTCLACPPPWGGMGHSLIQVAVFGIGTAAPRASSSTQPDAARKVRIYRLG